MIAVVLLLGLTLGPDEGPSPPTAAQASVAAERALDDVTDSSSGSQRRRSARRDAVASEDERRSAGIGGYVSALNIDSGTAVSFSGSFDFRFTRVVGLEI